MKNFLILILDFIVDYRKRKRVGVLFFCDFIAVRIRVLILKIKNVNLKFGKTFRRSVEVS